LRKPQQYPSSKEAPNPKVPNESQSIHALPTAKKAKSIATTVEQLLAASRNLSASE
jgi:hypothetical protein